MVILALETASRRGSVALWADEGLVAHAGETDRSHAERLPGELLDLLTAHGRRIEDVTLLAVVTGPGSFTGLRVGMAAMQGLAMARRLAVVPVATLDALAAGWLDSLAIGGPDHPDRRAAGGLDRFAAEPLNGLPAGGIVVSCLDGQRGDVFVSAIEVAGAATVDEARRVIEPMVATPDEAARLVAQRAGDRPVVVVGDGRRYEAVLREHVPSARLEESPAPLAATAARWAARHPDRAVLPHALRPMYLRRPDVELARDRSRRAAAAVAGLTIRRAGATDDLSDVAALQQDTFTNPWGTEAIRWELENTDVARLYVMRQPGGQLVGYCACWMIFDELHINSLAIAPAWRRHGYARELLQFVFRDAVAAGAQSATLEVRQSNRAAGQLYAGLGFHVEGVRRDYYQQPREDALVLWNRRLAEGR